MYAIYIIRFLLCPVTADPFNPVHFNSILSILITEIIADYSKTD